MSSEVEQKKIVFLERKDKHGSDTEAYKNKIDDFKEKI